MRKEKRKSKELLKTQTLIIRNVWKIEMAKKCLKFYHLTHPLANGIVFYTDLISVSSCLSKKIFYSAQLGLKELVFFLNRKRKI